jgi:hypothetical protein
VRCHLAFRALARDPPATPSEAVDQDERPETGSPFAFSARPGWGQVDEGVARAAPSIGISDSVPAVKQTTGHNSSYVHPGRAAQSEADRGPTPSSFDTDAQSGPMVLGLSNVGPAVYARCCTCSRYALAAPEFDFN